MLIGIDANEANFPQRVGVGQYAFNILWELYRQDLKNQYYIFLKNPPQNDLPKTKANWHYLVFGPQKLWTKIALPFYLYTKSPDLDLFYSFNHYSPLFSPFPCVPTIHDIGYLQDPSQFTKKDFYQLKNWTETSLKKSAHIVAVSQFTKDELVKTYQIDPQKISLVYNGVSQISKIKTQSFSPVAKKFHLTYPYFLAIGTLKPNKNYPFLIETFAKFLAKNPNYQLVIGGKKGWLYTDIAQLVAKLKLNSQIIFTDYLSETEKSCLYQNAVSLIIPSTYEGFGIPAIESQQAGTPVIASNISPLKEVLADTALYIDPYNSQTLLEAMTQIINPEIRQNLISKGLKQAQKFTWINSAKSLIKIFSKL
ncbi:MAG: glycosyltransferase family 1 protein [Candidatus Shapirobacteria bacterium]|jgi:glycosyltransferase involved in cell wall biosynthesis